MILGILGAGYTGTRLAELLQGEGHTVYGLRRNPPPHAPYHALSADLTDPSQLAECLPKTITHLVFAAAPGTVSAAGAASTPALTNTASAARSRKIETANPAYERTYVQGCRALLAVAPSLPMLERAIFVSSTSVYSESEGGWVTEATEPRATSWNGRCLLEAEQLFRQLPVTSLVFRCAGIYGPGRTRLLDSVRHGTASYDSETPSYMNRIHRDDVAGALKHLLTLDAPDPLYLGVDTDTAPDAVVLPWLAERMNAPMPRAVTTGKASNKRCSGERLRSSGYQFRFPSFREGYTAMLRV